MQYCPSTASNGMVFLEWDCHWFLRAVRPWSLAMVSWDVQEMLNGFEK